jgi:hypothetical protein
MKAARQSEHIPQQMFGGYLVSYYQEIKSLDTFSRNSEDGTCLLIHSDNVTSVLCALHYFPGLITSSIHLLDQIYGIDASSKLFFFFLNFGMD